MADVPPVIIQLEAGEPVVMLGGEHVGCFELFGLRPRPQYSRSEREKLGDTRPRKPLSHFPREHGSLCRH